LGKQGVLLGMGLHAQKSQQAEQWSFHTPYQIMFLQWLFPDIFQKLGSSEVTKESASFI